MRQRIKNKVELKYIRQELRNEGTAAEAVLWKALQRRQLGGKKFRRQFSVGDYVLDFYCPEQKLAVELDGGIHDDPEQQVNDAIREEYLQEKGIRIIRFTNDEVFIHLEAVLENIQSHFQSS